MAKIIDAIIRLKDQMTPNLTRINEKLSENEKINKRVSKSIQKTGGSITAFGAKVELLAAPLTAAAAAGIKLHSEFVNGMAKISTAIDPNVISLQKLSDGIRQVSDQTGKSVTELAAAEYQALSANVDAAHATEFMLAATKASTAGFSDTTTAVDGLTTMLNAYQLKTEDVTKISDQMIAAQALGKTTFNEIAQNIGQVATSAHMAGLSTVELLASIDAITKTGVKTPQAVIQIQGMITAIQKQSKQSQDAAMSIGMEFTEAHLKAVGMANFIEEIKNKSGGDSTIISRLFGRVEAANGFKEIAANLDDYRQIIDKINNSSGKTQETYLAMLTPAQQTAIAMNQIKNAGMDLAAGLAPLLLRTSKAMKYLAEQIKALTPFQKELLIDALQGIIIFGALTMAVGKLVSACGVWFGVYANMPKTFKEIEKNTKGLTKAFAKAKTGLSNFGTKLIWLATAFGSPRKSAEKLGTAVKNMYNSFSKTNKIGIFTKALEKIKDMGAGIVKTFKNIGTAFLHPIASFKKFVTILANGMKILRLAFISNPIGVALLALSIIIVFVMTHWQQFKEVAATVWNKISYIVGNSVDRISNKFSNLVSRTKRAFSNIIALWNRLTGQSAESSSVLDSILNTLGGNFVAAFGIVTAAIETALNVIIDVVDMIITVFNNIIKFIVNVFTGNWSAAWENVKNIFVGIFGGIRNIANDVIDGIGAAIDNVMGRAHSVSINPTAIESDDPEAEHWSGSSWFSGGKTWVNERGPELINLPSGSQIIPHSESLKQQYKKGLADAGNNNGGLSIQIPKLADTIIVREKEDVDNIANQIIFKIKQASINKMVGASI